MPVEERKIKANRLPPGYTYDTRLKAGAVEVTGFIGEEFFTHRDVKIGSPMEKVSQYRDQWFLGDRKTGRRVLLFRGNKDYAREVLSLIEEIYATHSEISVEEFAFGLDLIALDPIKQGPDDPLREVIDRYRGQKRKMPAAQ